MAEIPTPTTGYSGPSGERPLGVTILAILQVIGGVISIVASMLVLLFIDYIIEAFPIAAQLMIALAAVALIMGLLAFVVGWGLWSMKSWAWMAAILLNILDIIMAIPDLDYLSIIISLIIILYLQQGDIKRRFR